MPPITHHVPDAMLAAYAAGSLGYPFAVSVAAHVSLCDECRARHGAHLMMGGIVLETLADTNLSPGFRDRVLSQIDGPAEPASSDQGFDIYPAPIAQLLGGKPPRWRAVGLGTKQAILWRGTTGSVRLLHIPAGQAVPDHGHRGLELTLVLSGAFHDEGGSFEPGDIEVADEDVVHTPTAAADAPCICLAATDARLRFRSLVPRLAQPFLRI